VGIGQDENFVASDANAIVAYTKKVVYLNDYDVATVTPERLDVQNLGADTANVQISNLEFSQEDAVRGSTRISCSRRFSSSRGRYRMPCGAGLTSRPRRRSLAA